MNPTSTVHIEKEETLPLAVIYNGNSYGQALKKALEAQNLRAVHLEAEKQALSVLEKPEYIFFFASKKSPLSLLRSQFSQATETSTEKSAKIICILDNLDSVDEAAVVGNVPPEMKLQAVEIKGILDEEQIKEAVSKLVRLAFSSRTTNRQVIVGKMQEAVPFVSNERSVVEKPEKPKQENIPKRGSHKKAIGVFAGVALAMLIVISPMVLIGGSILLSVSQLVKTKDYLQAGEFDLASQQAIAAKNGFSSTGDFVRRINTPMELIGLGKPLEKVYDILVLGKSSADEADRISQTAGKMMGLSQDFISGSSSTDLATLATSLRGEIAPINQNLGLIQAQVLGINTERVSSILSFLGLPVDRLEKYISEIPTARKYLSSVESVLSILPQIAPPDGKKVYLIVFQNSAELRATGGFIGSYGIVNFDQGKLINWQIYDIYSADGQLKGQIAPPDEILHYAGQPSWFMRDANWSPDWPLSAKRLEWFLEKETGQKVDGVVGVSLGAVSKLLQATGPLTLADLNDTVSADNFFQKAEYSAEINFFPGSTQKKDYLGAVAKALFEKITQGKDNDSSKLGQAIIGSLEQKDIIFYFNSDVAQKVFSQNGWAGEIAPQNCQDKGDNCISIIDSNLGSNKANYFVTKNVQLTSAISKAGDIDTTITINYKNSSPSDTWPGGRYKNYLRILVPQGSKMTNFSIGDNRTPWVTPILTEKELAKVTTQQFLVFQTMEEGYNSYGALIEVPIQSTRRVTFTFRHPYKVAVSQENPVFTLTVIKQPGTSNDPLDFSVDYPSFLTPIDYDSQSTSPLAIPQKLIYNSDLGTNQTFEVHFKRQI